MAVNSCKPTKPVQADVIAQVRKDGYLAAIEQAALLVDHLGGRNKLWAAMCGMIARDIRRMAEG